MSVMRLRLALVVSLLIGLTPGCFIFGTKESKLVAGEEVEVGKRKFDAYFEEIATFRDTVEDVETDHFSVREPLIDQLDVDVEAGVGTLLDATGERMGKIRDFGVQTSLQLTPEPKVIRFTGKDIEARAEDEPLFRAVEKSATVALERFREHQQLLSRLAELDRRRGELAEEIDDLGAQDADARETIETEIVGAGKVLREAEKKLLASSRTLSHFLLGLATTVDTGAIGTYASECEEARKRMAEKEKEKPKRPQPRWRPRPRPAGPRPPPKPAPAGGDFEM